MPVVIERLPAERTSALPVAAAAGGCCSCCCCCFHTLGSLVGAALARPEPLPLESEAPPVATIAGVPTEPKYSAHREYWTAFLACSVALMMILGVWLDGGDKLAGMVILYAVFAPAVQLAASLVALVMILSSKRPGRSQRLNHLGRMTLYALLGALIGGAVVWAMFQR